MKSTETSLYRKYRPTTFGDVIGQEHVVTALENAIKKDQIGHAYLLYGTRGIGKTTLARIFANEIGTKPEDLYEIDAASYTGVDNIRELNASVKALPFQSKYKVYIIDEVHMLSKSAFNALLKTIEEPPSHAIFVLATTELEKVIDTIISRCQVFTLRTPTIETLRTLVDKVSKSEEVTLSAESKNTIALLGDGSFRDTLGALQKIITVSDKKDLSDEEVQKITGAPTGKLIREIIKSLGNGNTDQVLTATNQAKNLGIEARTLSLQIIQYLRSLLLIRFAPSLHQNIADDIGKDMFDFLHELRGKEAIHANARLLAEMLEATYDAQRSHTPYLPLELAIISHGESIHS